MLGLDGLARRRGRASFPPCPFTSRNRRKPWPWSDVEQVADDRLVGLHAKRRAARVGGEVRREAVRERRKDRDAERLGRLDGDALGEDRVDREREVAVLLDRAERQDDAIVVLEVPLDLHPVAVRRSSRAQPLEARRRRERTSASAPGGRRELQAGGQFVLGEAARHRDGGQPGEVVRAR